MEECETEEGSAAMFLTTFRFIRVVLPYAMRKRLGGWGSSLPHFDINQRSSQPSVFVFHILGFCVKCHQEGKREGKEGWRKEGKMEGRKRKKENQCVRELRYAHMFVCGYVHAHVPSVIMKGVFRCVLDAIAIGRLGLFMVKTSLHFN